MPKILIEQPSAMPTRKVLATIIAGGVTGAIMAALQAFAPWLPQRELLAIIDPIVVAAVASAAGYLTRDAV